jgi:hypothetical protein
MCGNCKAYSEKSEDQPLPERKRDEGSGFAIANNFW